jgi:hypothetical protein
MASVKKHIGIGEKPVSRSFYHGLAGNINVKKTLCFHYI